MFSMGLTRKAYMDSSRLPTAFLILVEIANVYPACG